MDFSQVKFITIPEGSVSRILSGTTVLWKKPSLPVEYQGVEYIESSGTQYIDTGMVGTNNTKVDIEFQATGEKFLPFGARKGSANSCFAIWASGPNVGTPLRIGFDSTSGYTGEATTADKYHIIHSQSGAYVNDSLVWTPPTRTFTTPQNLIVFGYYSTATARVLSAIRLFHLKLWESNIRVRDFMPCYRKSDNVVGLYDLVSDTFFTNSGTGEFVKGPDI